MKGDTFVFIGREGMHTRETLQTHAERIKRRGAVDTVHVVMYAEEPVRELRDELSGLSADRAFVLPACIAHSRETTDVLPAVLSYVDGDVRYCEPIGRSPAITSLIKRRASAHLNPDPDTTLVLVGQGASSQPYHRQTAEYHAARICEQSAYGDVISCYLLQNPAVECVRYNISTEQAVTVPLFLTSNDATTERIPERLELRRGGIEYADPFGDHALVTDAVHAEIAKQRALAESESTSPVSFEGALAAQRRPIAADGEGEDR